MTVINKEHYVDVDFTSTFLDNSNKDISEVLTSNVCRIVGDYELDIRSSSIPKGKGYILLYEIIHSSIKPFLLYRFVKRKDMIEFETVMLEKGTVPAITDAKYMGLYHYNEEPYLFFLKHEEDFVVSKMNSKHKYYNLMIHDITNEKKNFGIPVSDKVSTFFIKNEQFIFLENENNILIETPVSGYRGDFYRRISIMAGLGMSRSGPYASMGPFYYFGSYDRAMRYAAITMNGKPLEINGELLTIKDTPVYTKGGIVKYALFLGSSKVMLNLPDDPKDTSFASQKLASKRAFINDTLRIRDTNGTWISQFDSMIQPVLDIYDRDLDIKRTLDPQFVVKSYNQQLPLEYAYYKTDHISKDISTGFYNTHDIAML